MRCPACQATHGEDATACAACGFSLAALEATLGPPPAVTGRVTDLAGELRMAEIRRLADDLALLEQQFPGLRALLVIATPPAPFTMELYAFWLFNRAGVFSQVEKGGGNHGLMLLIDPAGSVATVALGYGLEPLMPAVAVEACLALTRRYLDKRQPAAAAAGFFREMQRQLAQAAPQWPQVFGMREDLPWFDSAAGVLSMSGPEDGGDAH